MNNTAVCIADNVLPSTGIVSLVVFLVLAAVFLSYQIMNTCSCCENMRKQGNLVVLVFGMLPLRAVTLDVIAASSKNVEEVKTLVYMGIAEAIAYGVFSILVCTWAYSVLKTGEEFVSKLVLYALIACGISLLPSFIMLFDKVISHYATGIGALIVLIATIVTMAQNQRENRPKFTDLKACDYITFWVIVVGFSALTYFVEECATLPFLSGLLSIFPSDAFILFLRFGRDSIDHFRQIAHFLLYVSTIEIIMILLVTIMTELRAFGILSEYTTAAITGLSLIVLGVAVAITVSLYICFGFAGRTKNKLEKKIGSGAALDTEKNASLQKSISMKTITLTY